MGIVRKDERGKRKNDTRNKEEKANGEGNMPSPYS